MTTPFVYCDYRHGQLKMTVFGSLASAKPEDEIRYVESASFRFHRKMMEMRAEQHRPFGHPETPK